MEDDRLQNDETLANFDDFETKIAFNQFQIIMFMYFLCQKLFLKRQLIYNRQYITN